MCLTDQRQMKERSVMIERQGQKRREIERERARGTGMVIIE